MTDAPIKIAPTLESLRARRDEILTLAEKYGGYDVRIFGSVARGDATPESDVDFLMRFHEWVSLYELAGIGQDLQELLEWNVDFVEDHAGLRERFRKRIMKDVVAL